MKTFSHPRACSMASKLFDCECSEHANTVIEQAMWREGCVLNPSTLHNDNGSVLTSHLVHQKLQSKGKGIAPSHSRLRVSDDNVYIESLFRTLKYGPMWPSQVLDPRARNLSPCFVCV